MKEMKSNKSTKPIKVLVVDDSPMMCKAIEQILIADDEIGSITKALNGQEALKALSTQKYDVCTLDVHMPGMNGLTVLKNIMIKYPLPTLMVSAFTAEGSKVTFEALRFGAVDFFKKPTRNGDGDLIEQAHILRAKLKRASRVQVEAARYLRVKPKASIAKSEGSSLHKFKGISILYGSTGCYSSLLSILPHLNDSLKTPVIIAMDSSRENILAFIDYLKSYCIFPLKLADKIEKLQSRTIYFIPEGYAAYFDKNADYWEMTVEKRPIETEGEGAIDLTLLSASEVFGEALLLVVVSGDNQYGLTGTKEVLRNNGTILVQAPRGCLAPSTPQIFLDKFNTTSLEPYKISQKICEWGND